MSEPEKERKKADIHDVGISDVNTGIETRNVDANITRFDISDVDRGIVHSGGNAEIAYGTIRGGKIGIQIGGDRTDLMDEIVNEIEKLDESQKADLVQSIHQYRKTSQASEKKELLRGMIANLLARGLTVFVDTLFKRFGDALPLPM